MRGSKRCDVLLAAQGCIYRQARWVDCHNHCFTLLKKILRIEVWFLISLANQAPCCCRSRCTYVRTTPSLLTKPKAIEGGEKGWWGCKEKLARPRVRDKPQTIQHRNTATPQHQKEEGTRRWRTRGACGRTRCWPGPGKVGGGPFGALPGGCPPSPDAGGRFASSTHRSAKPGSEA